MQALELADDDADLQYRAFALANVLYPGEMFSTAASPRDDAANAFRELRIAY